MNWAMRISVPMMKIRKAIHNKGSFGKEAEVHDLVTLLPSNRLVVAIFPFHGSKNPWLDGQGMGKAQRLTNFITKTIYLYIIPMRSQTKKGATLWKWRDIQESFSQGIARDRLQWVKGNDKCHFEGEQPIGEDGYEQTGSDGAFQQKTTDRDAEHGEQKREVNVAVFGSPQMI
jgi:hypothetical protein